MSRNQIKQHCPLGEPIYKPYIWQSWLHGEFIPDAGTIDRENDMRLFKYGSGPADEPSNLYQFIFDYRGISLRAEIKQVLKYRNVFWRG